MSTTTNRSIPDLPRFTATKPDKSNQKKCPCTCGCEILVFALPNENLQRCYKCRMLDIHGTQVKKERKK